MAKITKVTLDNINDAFGTSAQSPVDIANNIKNYASSNGDTLDTAQMVVSALNTLETFASAVAKYETPIPGVVLSSVSLGLNIEKARLELKMDFDHDGVPDNRVQNGTLNSIFADMSSLTTDVGISAKNPYVVGLGLTGSLGFSIATFLSTEGDTGMANGIAEFASDTYNTYNQVTDSLSGSKTEFLDTVDYLYSASGLVQDQYQDYKDIMSDTSSSNLEFPTLSSWLKDNNTAIKIDSDDIVQYLDTLGVEKVLIDNQTYTIQSGDNLSQIAQANNTTIDKLIENNSWLTEENRISSDGSYALIKPGEKLNLTVDNKTTGYGIDDTNDLTPEYQIDLTTKDVISLKEGQTVSDIAKLTNKSSIDLLEYNNMTLEEAKSLPVGEPIRIYEGEPETINTPEGNIKLFENYDGSETAILPEGITGEKTTINFDEDSSTLLYGDRTNPDKITYVDEITNHYIEISKDSNGSYYKVKESNNESLLLNILFLPISSLSQKKYSSFSLLNSNILFSQSLELEKNRVSNNRFSGRDIA